MEIKFKPVYRYQSAEFTVDTDKMPMGEAMELYEDVLSQLKAVADRVCPEEGQPKVVVKKPEEPKAELATDKQKAVMARLGVNYNTRTTKAEARALIQKAISEQNM